MTGLVSEPTYPRARCAHRCSWHPFAAGDGGRHRIEAGELYERQALSADAGIYVWRSCAYHRAAANAAFAAGWHEQLDEHELAEYMYEWWNEAMWHAERGLEYPMPFDALATFETAKVPA